MKTKELLLWIAIGTALRFSLALGRFLWYDESFTGLLALQPLSGLLAGTAADVHPPLYYLVAWPVMQIISDLHLPLWMLRLPSILAGTGSIWLMSKAAPAIGLDQRLARVLVAVTAITPAQVWYGSEARQYALLTALFLAAAWAIGARRWGWFTAAAVALCYTHNYGTFYSGGLAAFALFRNWKDWARILRAGGITLAAWLPWGVVLANQISRIDGSYWLEPIGHGPVVTALVVMLAGFDLDGGMLIAAAALGITLILIALTRRPPLALWALAIIPALLAGLASATITNLWLFRALTPAQPFMVGLALWPFVQGWDFKPARWLAVALFAPVMIGGLVGQQQTGWDKSADSATAALAIIRAQWQDGDVIVNMTDGSAVHLGLKAPDLPQVKLADCSSTPGALTEESRRTIGITEVDEIPAAKRIWLTTGVGLNTPACMIEQTAALVGGTDPVYEWPFNDYFVDEIYLVDLSTTGR